MAALAWASDRRRLASASANQGCWIIELDSAQPFWKVAELPGSQRFHGATWTRDGSSVIGAIEETRGELGLFERE